MGMLDAAVSTIRDYPHRTIIYGKPGIGKTTFAASFPRPFFVQTEDGAGAVNATSLGVDASQTMADIGAQLIALHRDKHDFKTLAIDSLDRLEDIIERQVAAECGMAAFAAIPWGRGPGLAALKWAELLEMTDPLRRDRGMEIVLIGHARCEDFQDPERETYKRYTLTPHEKVTYFLRGWTDELLFATDKTIIRQVSEKAGQHRNQGVGTGERVLRTTERPAHLAKNRYDLPDEIPLTRDNPWATYRAAIVAAKEAKAKREKEIKK